MRFLSALVVLFLLATLAVVSANGDYPTVTALEEAIIPPRDRFDLARRFLGVTHIPALPTTPPTYHIGDRATFNATNLGENRPLLVNAILRAAGQHIYMWVEEGANVNDDDLQYLADVFDTQIYAQVRELWGSEPKPGVDGDPRVYALFARDIGGGTAAYFASQHTYPTQIVPNSNQREMFFFNLDAVGRSIGSPVLEGILAHEFQHMIRSHIDSNEDTWLDEGFSTFTELYLGYDNSLFAALSFLSQPNTQLNHWSKDGDRQPHYGAAFLFTTYFFERYGLPGIQALSAEQKNGLESVDAVLQAMDQPGAEVFFADWVLANGLMLPDSLYGYRMLPRLPRATTRGDVSVYPYFAAGRVNQYATDYFLLSNLRGKKTLNVRFTMPTTVMLFPAQPLDGRWMWYSNKGDESNTMLTRAFDLRGVSSATLRYKIWYALERWWDYGYISISVDSGAAWTPLAGRYTTRENPNGLAYGVGYTGTSNGWVQESIALDAYTGQEVLLRFEMITDDAITDVGMIIDDVNIAQIGYFSDFETDGGGWEAQGWLRTDNLLPQQAWVQLAQQTDDQVQVTRWLLPSDDLLRLTLLPDVDQALVAISPFAPVTTLPMQYTITIEAQG